MLLKVYLKLKLIIKDGNCSYCNGEIKERFVSIVPFFLQMTIKVPVPLFVVVLHQLLHQQISFSKTFYKIIQHFLKKVFVTNFPFLKDSPQSPIPLSAKIWEGLNLQPNFQKKEGGLTGPQLLEGGCWKREG